MVSGLIGDSGLSLGLSSCMISISQETITVTGLKWMLSVDSLRFCVNGSIQVSITRDAC